MTTEPTLGRLGIAAVEGRGISSETAVRLGLYTGRMVDGEVVPYETGNIVVFPFFEQGRVVAEKYRAPGKCFWQKPGGRRTFYNAGVLDDPALARGDYALIITEGEIDCLTAIDCGFPFATSVPDGAPPVKEGEKPDELPPEDPGAEQSGKFEFVWNNRERLKRIKRFILAVDNDPPGQRLAAELVRRLSTARCSFVEYPEGCKDLNEVLMRLGRDAVTRVLNSAKPYPVRGLYRLSDYPDLPPVPTFSTGWETVDRNLKLFAGEFMVVTGIPSHGKSTWVMNLMVNAARLHRWRTAIFTPEMRAVPHMRDKLRRIIGGDSAAADAFVNEAFLFIDSDPAGCEVDDFDLDWIIDKATDAVQRDGIRVLVIDPWNEVEHARRRDETMVDYIARAIRALKRFARRYDVAVIVIAHPTKDVKERGGECRAPTLYDIEGAAHWFNKADHGLALHRLDSHSTEVALYIQKVRFDETGEKGEVRLAFDPESCRYGPLDQARPPCGNYGG